MTNTCTLRAILEQPFKCKNGTEGEVKPKMVNKQNRETKVVLFQTMKNAKFGVTLGDFRGKKPIKTKHHILASDKTKPKPIRI